MYIFLLYCGLYISTLNNKNTQYCSVKFYQAIFKEPPSCPADILPPKGEGCKVRNKKMLAPFGGKWRVSVERGHEIHISIKCKNIFLQDFISHNCLFFNRYVYCKMFINRQFCILISIFNVIIFTLS